MRWSAKNFGILIPLLVGALLVIAVFASVMVSSVVAETDANPRLRIAHFAPFASGSMTETKVSVALYNTSGNVVWGPQDMEYLDSLVYFSTLSQGSYSFRVFTADGGGTPVIEEDITLNDDIDYSALIIGDDSNQDLALSFETDDNSAPGSGKAKLRFGHVAPFDKTTDDTLVDIRYQNGRAVATNVPYGDIADSYLELDAGSYDFKITEPGGEVTLIDPLTITLSSGDIHDIYAIGDGTKQPLGVFVRPNDGTGASFPLSTKANLQIVHLGPLDFEGLSSTAITITFDGIPVVTNFEYGESTTYTSIEAKTYTVRVFIGDNPLSISQMLNYKVGMDYTLFFRGGNSDTVVGLDQVTNNNAAPPAGKAKLRFGNLAPFLVDSRVDIRLQDGTLVVEDLHYRKFTDYLQFDAGANDFKITTVGGEITLVDPEPINLSAGDIGMLVASGDARTKPIAAFLIPNGKMGGFVPSDTPVPEPPGLSIRKSPVVQNVEYGETVTFTISVTNTGAVTLTNVTVTDTLVPDCNETWSSLSPAENKQKTCSKANVTESFLNVAEVTGKPPGMADPITARDTAAVNMTTKFIYLPYIARN